MAKKEEEKAVFIKKSYGGGGVVYGLGFLGALVYYISHANTFWQGVLGIIKALLWPALLVYNLLDFLKI